MDMFAILGDNFYDQTGAGDTVIMEMILMMRWIVMEHLPLESPEPIRKLSDEDEGHGTTSRV